MAQRSRHRNVLQWMRDQVQPVPLEMALCEFDCCKTTCTNRDWRTCQSRIAFTASGKHVYPNGLSMKTRRHWYVPEPAASYPGLPVPVYASTLS
jgi:hypothetical protein